MNPDEFSWNEDEHVTVTNPTAETYVWKVHNKEYQLAPGKTAKMPGYIAWVYVYGLSTQLAQADGVFNRWNEEGFRQEYYEKLVSGVDNIVQAVEVQPAPLVETLDDDEDEFVPEDQLPAGGETYEPTIDPSDDEEGEDESAKPAPVSAQPKAKASRRGRSASRS